MEFWDNIVHTALLGTDKRQLKKEDFSEDFAETIELINEQATDKESQFLNLASAAFNYRKCGVEPLNKTLVYSKAEVEERAYCSPFAHQLLSDIISVESFPLLKLWLELCFKNNIIVKPEWIPVLFDLGIKHKPLQSLLLPVTGKRGEWLIQFNEAWKVETKSTDEEVWQTGTLEQRKDYLRKLRTTEPSQARELLQQAWASENVNTKTELVKSLATNISNEDVAWLEQLLNEKSQKVKDETLRLLKLSRTSSIIQKYWEIIKQSVEIKKERGLLGIGSKTVLEIELISNIDESIFKSGIEKITSEKNVSDNDFILYQLIAAVPPSFFEQHFQLDKKELFDLFLKSKNGKPFILAFGTAAITFKEVDWLRAVMAVSENQFFPQAFEMLPSEETEKYALQFLNKPEAHQVIDYFAKYYQGEWSIALTREIFKFTVKNQYSYNRSFYSQNILSIPAAIIPEFDTFAPREEYLKNMWDKTSEHIFELLTLKTQTLNAFK
ncbi:MAG: hypothetical protein JWQ09_3456 [Segetibacter sp.]|nr:hypothetical protein [Segetibacter sp.]